MSRVALALLITGCSAPDVWRAIADVPAEAPWIAVITLDAEGRLVASSGIVRREAGSSLLSIVAPAEELTVLAWRAEDLAAQIGASDEVTLARARLVEATDRDPILPPPMWSASGRVIDGLAALAVEAAPSVELTTSWLPACPKLIDREAEVEIACSACHGVVTQAGCALALSTQGCGFDSIAANVSARGTLALDPPDFLQSCAPGVATSSAATQAFVCTRADDGSMCRIQMFEEIAAPSFDVATISPLGPKALHDNRRDRREIEALAGYFAGLVITNESAIVAAYPAVSDWRCALDEDAPSTLLFLSLQTQPRLVRTATTEACLTMLVRDPVGPGFLGVYGLGPQRLGRFDAGGRLTDSVEVPRRGTDLVVAMALSKDAQTIALVASDPVDSGAIALMTIRDVRTLEQRVSLIELADKAHVVAPVGADAFEAFEGDDAGSATIDAVGERTIIGTRENVCDLPLRNVWPIGLGQAASISDDLTLISARGFSPALLWVRPGDEFCAASATYEHGLEPHAVLALDGHAAYGGTSAAHDAYVGLLDARARELVRGATRVGKGAISQLVRGPEGELWAVLTGEGSIARLVRR